jgi:hypothetical protein
VLLAEDRAQLRMETARDHVDLDKEHIDHKEAATLDKVRNRQLATDENQNVEITNFDDDLTKRRH